MARLETGSLRFISVHPSSYLAIYLPFFGIYIAIAKPNQTELN